MVTPCMVEDVGPENCACSAPQKHQESEQSQGRRETFYLFKRIPEGIALKARCSHKKKMASLMIHVVCGMEAGLCNELSHWTLNTLELLVSYETLQHTWDNAEQPRFHNDQHLPQRRKQPRLVEVFLSPTDLEVLTTSTIQAHSGMHLYYLQNIATSSFLQ